ncbi:hypothetical protein JM18_004997 [Phytophthora kernoviae]|uniref:cDENN domain-containing protein n=2 Tax=Phytophthora kernoviae TaxID=325452 RepID=A0A8T0M150_9STRA|nr:hypothetical protein G195_006712 [Phytophthora kernoviae 00238/432]KAG2525198.1 hypothetical protein JM18_004997 [Phytophthora kernoviae]KAG2525904.1 hypothetical protein JM16_004167 [Phytophthora kernoviae]
MRVGRPQQDTTPQPEDSESDEDWDAEFGFDDQTDNGLGSSGSMDPTRRRAENGNFFLPNLHEVLDGESLPDDEEMEMDAVSPVVDGIGRRPRRASEEPLFQRRRSDFHQSGASADGSLDGIRTSFTSASASSSTTIEYSLVDKLKLLEVANSSAYAVRIERYPKPSSSFSNLERDRTNFPSFTENKYERWLADLVVPDCAVVSHHMESERNRLPPPRQLKNQHFHALVSLPFGCEFVDTFFKQITHYRYFGEDKENRELVRMYFEKVSTTGMTDENWASNLPPHELEFVVGCSMEILQEAARLYGPKPVVPLATHLSLSMLSTSSSASSQGNKTTIYWIQQFQDIMLHCAEAFPQYQNVVALIELRYVCHHLAGFASGEYEYQWQLCNQLPSFLPLEPLAGDSASQIVNEVLQYYGALFQHLNTSPESRSNRYMAHKGPVDGRNLQTDDTRQFGLSSDVICLQALIMCDIQSLYDSKSALAEISLPALEELLEFEDDEATVDPILVGLLPHNRDSRSSSSSSNPDFRDSGYERGDPSKGLGGWSASAKLFELLRPLSRSRTSALSFFYERMSATKFPLVKAKCASVLAGMHVSGTAQGNLRVAESLAYEALRLLEAYSKSSVAKLSKVPSLRSRGKIATVSYLSIFNNDGLLSDLGREALENLGNILIKNNKYRYGILCLEAAGALFSFLNQGCEYEKLDRLLCKLTLEADDVHRALPLHEKVTCAAQQQGNITVYVYLTQEMTKLWIREGNFTRAEEYLATACHFLRDHTNLLPPHFLSAVINGSYSSSEAPSSRSGTMMTATSSSVSSSLSGSFHLSSRSTGNASEVDTWLNHDINLHLLVRDVYRSSGRCLEGMRVLEHLLNYSTRLPRGKRTQLRMLLAEDALKMRMFDTCRHMFSLMEREATAFCDRLQENIKGFSGPGSSSGTGPGTSSSGGGRSLGGMGSEARYCFDMSFSLRYITCRVKMYLKLGDYCNAFVWLSLAHVKNNRDNLRKQAELYVLDGKVLRAYCREQQEREWERRRDGEESIRRGRSTFVGSVVSPAQVEDMLKPLGVSLYGLNKEEKQRLHDRMVLFATCVRDVDKAEEQALNSFWSAFDLYRLLDDSLHQLKVLLEIISFMLAPIQRSFFALGSNMDDEMLKSHLHRRSSGKGDSALDVNDPSVMLGGDDTIEKTRKTLLEVQKLLRPALNMAEQVANPASFLQTLIFCSEVWVWLERIASYKSEKHLKEATAFWEEAVRVMKGVFFRRVAFHDVADASTLNSSIGFGNDFVMPFARGGNRGRFCVVPILNFSEGFIVKLETMTLQLILTACQLQQFERVPEYVEETLLTHLDELLSARMCLSSIVHQLRTENGFGHDEGSSSNGAIGLCDFDEVQSEKLWWIFNLWRDAKTKYVDGKIETSEFRSRNLRYLRTLLDAFDPQQIAVLYYGGLENASTDSVVTPGGSRVAPIVNTGNPNGMLDFDVARMNSHALIQDRQLVLSIGYDYASETRRQFGTTPKLQFKVFSVREGDTKLWRQEIPRPDWYLSEYDTLEAEEASVGAGVLHALASDKMLRNAVPLPKKWRRQFLERIEKVARQRHKMRAKTTRRHSGLQLASSRGPTTPASASGMTSQSMRSPAGMINQSMRSPAGAYPQADLTLRSYDDALSTSRSGSSWMVTPASTSGVSDSDAGNYQLMQSGGVQLSSDPNGLDERQFYDSECAAAFVSGLREFYDKLLGLCAERKTKGKKKKSPSSGHSKRQEIKSWFSSSHDFDAFVDNFQSTEMLDAFEKEKAASQAEAQAQARALHLMERQSSEHEVSSTSSGRSTRFALSNTPKSLKNSFSSQQLKSFGSFSSLTASNRSSGGQERRR